MFYNKLFTCPDLVVKIRPIKQADEQRIAVITGFLTRTILLSFREVITPSSVPNIEPKPNISNIKKNRIAHNGGIGN